MSDEHSPFAAHALERSVPRYTSYPTAPNFSEAVNAEAYRRWLAELHAETPLSLYLHIPFCDDLCWFCACRTQGTRRYAQIERYLSHLVREIEMVADLLPETHTVSQVHLGGGSPTVLHPEDTGRLIRLLKNKIPGVEGAELAVEIDPRDMTDAKLDALAVNGLTRASIGVQDFDEAVQKAIGRMQGWEMTRDVIHGLRKRGVEGINIDFLYGLPGQTCETLADTIEKVVALEPDRLALFGYAHVPWMAKRQKMIDASTLPDSVLRKSQAEMAANILIDAGYEAVGIDHFAKPGDSLARAAHDKTLKRNFQGYTVDPSDALIGFGASAIGCLPQGYVQNESSTAAYQLLIEAGKLATRRGHRLNLNDQLHRDLIEQILCRFEIDWAELHARYGDFVEPVMSEAEKLIADAPPGAFETTGTGVRIAERWRTHARLIAAEFDTYLVKNPTKHSLAV